MVGLVAWCIGVLMLAVGLPIYRFVVSKDKAGEWTIMSALFAGTGLFVEPFFTSMWFSVPFWLAWNCVIPLVPYSVPRLCWGQALGLILLVRIMCVIGGGLQVPFKGVKQ